MLRFRAGKSWIPVTLSRVGKKLAIFPARPTPELEEEFRSWVGGEKDYATGAWLVTDCERNCLQIESLQGRDVFAHLKAPTPLTGTRPELMEHQKRLVGSGVMKGCGIWASEQGTGKTLAAIELLEAVKGTWWWVGPARVLEDTKLQFTRWNAKVLPQFWISWHGLASFLQKYRGPAPLGFVGDESTILKGCGPIYKALKHLSEEMTKEHGRLAFKILMSGKPAPNDPTDWWAQAEIVCPGLLRESSVADLRRRLAVIDDSEGYPVVKSWRLPEVEKLGRRLAPVVTVIRAADCLDLPERRIEVVDLKVDPEMLQAAQLVAASAPSGAQALNLLRQLSDGFQYSPDGVATRCPTPKDDFLRARLQACEEDGRVAIYASYRESIDRCVEICKEEGWEVLRCDGRGWDPGPEMLGEFDAATSSGQGKKAFVGHPMSGGFGLNLTAPREQILYSLDFNWGAYDQTIKRLHRLGQTRGVTVLIPSHLPTDRYVHRKLEKKEELQNVTLDEVRRVLG